MRITAGKIYFWGAVSIATLTVWNRLSTRHLRSIVDGIKEEKMREAEQLRSHNERRGIKAPELTPEQRQKQMMAERGAPSFFNPYYDQQQKEYAAMKNSATSNS